VLSCGVDTYTIDPSKDSLHPRIYNGFGDQLDTRLANVMIDRLKRKDKIEEKLHPEKVYPLFVSVPLAPIILLPDEQELDKSPEEIEKFTSEDVRDFCEMNYEKTRYVLGVLYKIVAEELKEN